MDPKEQKASWSGSDHDLLIRIDTRTEDIGRTMKELEGRYVTQDQFWPVKTIVYAGAGIVMTGVLVALVLLVVRGLNGSNFGIPL